MQKHLADQHGEDPIRFNLQRDPTFATLSPPRTYASDAPVVVNPTMFDRVLHNSLAMRRAVNATTEVRHRNLRQQVVGGFESTPEVPSISYATRESAASWLQGSSINHRSTLSMPPYPPSSSFALPSEPFTRLPAGAPTSTMDRSPGFTGPARLPPPVNVASTSTSLLSPTNETWAVLDESGNYAYITPAQFEEYCNRPL